MGNEDHVCVLHPLSRLPAHRAKPEKLPEKLASVVPLAKGSLPLLRQPSAVGHSGAVLFCKVDVL